jgi:myo-inositol-1(or 4)-monophosphatase
MLKEITDTAIEAALKAGKILKNGFGTAFEISSKEGKNNLVTEYDRLSEETIINLIKDRFPESSFLAEESGSSGNKYTGALHWIIDPLDGTVNFAHNLPVFSISIAAVLDGKLVSGVIYHPILDELFVASIGGGATMNGNVINVSHNSVLDESFLVTGFPYNINTNPCGCMDQFEDIIMRGIPVRRLGSAALDLAYVACGRFDGFWEINLNPWDVAAGVLLVKEAGGRVTQYNDTDYRIGSQSILATNGMLHREFSSILSQCSCGIKYED